MHSKESVLDWAGTTEKLKGRFSKLTDDNIESLKGSLDLLSAKLQSVYGYAKDKADKEFESFKSSLHDVIGPEKKDMESDKKEHADSKIHTKHNEHCDSHLSGAAIHAQQAGSNEKEMRKS